MKTKFRKLNEEAKNSLAGFPANIQRGICLLATVIMKGKAPEMPIAVRNGKEKKKRNGQ